MRRLPFPLVVGGGYPGIPQRTITRIYPDDRLGKYLIDYVTVPGGKLKTTDFEEFTEWIAGLVLQPRE